MIKPAIIMDVILIGKPSINGPFSMAMLNNQMVGLMASQSR
jgi:hypothetical protein